MQEKIQRWLNEPMLDATLKNELLSLSDAELSDAFYKDVSFGTGGIRGVIGVGTNRLNIYTVRKALVGFSRYLLKTNPNIKAEGIVIAHDNRHNNVLFAHTCVGVLAAHGIKSYLFDSLRPTPLLSFAVRELNAGGGIMITASHNPPKYNGLKMYDREGCQLVPALANQVIDEVQAIDNLFSLTSLPYEEAQARGLVDIIGRAVDQAYLDALAPLKPIEDGKKTLKVVFTPLHGTAREVGLRALSEAGFTVHVVESQMVTDPDFKTVKSPNPENQSAFELAESLGHETKADLLIATDPDADRLGIAVRHHDQYVYLNGNQTGALLIDYLARKHQKEGTTPKHGLVYTTIVTSDFGPAIAAAYGFEVRRTLTGFKYIGEQMATIEKEAASFVMGYEESYGYVLHDIVRDKDAIQALLVCAYMAEEALSEDKTLVDVLEALYERHGYYADHLMNIELEGQVGEAHIQAIMTHFRDVWPEAYLSQSCLIKEDYLTLKRTYHDGKEDALHYPEENVLKFIFREFWFVLRPSGTEPKLKVYLMHQGASTKEETYVLLATLRKQLQREIDEVIASRKDLTE